MNLAAMDMTGSNVPTGPVFGPISEFDAHWASLPKVAGLPMLRDFQPEHVSFVIPNMMVKDVLRDPLDFQFRLVGSALSDEFGKDYSGRKFSEIKGHGRGSHVWENNQCIVEDRAVSCVRIPYEGRGGAFWQIHQASYPFSEHGFEVDCIFTVIEFHKRMFGA